MWERVSDSLPADDNHCLTISLEQEWHDDDIVLKMTAMILGPVSFLALRTFSYKDYTSLTTTLLFISGSHLIAGETDAELQRLAKGTYWLRATGDNKHKET